MNKKLKRTFIWNLCSIINAFTVIFYLFNVSLRLIPKHLHSSISKKQEHKTETLSNFYLKKIKHANKKHSLPTKHCTHVQTSAAQCATEEISAIYNYIRTVFSFTRDRRRFKVTLFLDVWITKHSIGSDLNNLAFCCNDYALKEIQVLLIKQSPI